MKNYLVILFLFTLVVGCSGGKNIDDEEIPSKVLVEITRSVAGNPDPQLYIAAENAYFKEGVLIIEGAVSITGQRSLGAAGKWWVVPKIEIREGRLEIPIPNDPHYDVTISKR